MDLTRNPLLLFEMDERRGREERSYMAAPHDTEARGRYVRSLLRSGETEKARAVHFSPLREHGHALAHLHRTVDDPREDAERRAFHQEYRDTLKRAWNKGADLWHDWQEHHDTNHNRKGTHPEMDGSVREQIAKHIPREPFQAGELGHATHRDALMTAFMLGGHQRPSSTPQPNEGYRGTGSAHFYGEPIRRALSHHGYDKSHDIQVGPPVGQRTGINVFMQRKGYSSY